MIRRYHDKADFEITSIEFPTREEAEREKDELMRLDIERGYI